MNTTSYGRFLKRLRVDTGDTLVMMAEKLNVSVSFLSSLESGVREIPPDLSNTIRTIYQLDGDASDALLKAECETLHKSISISLGSYKDNEEFKKAAISISRDLQELPINEVKKLAADIHEKAQTKRKDDFSGWKTAIGVVAVALGVGLALAAASNKDDEKK